jgi:hypothetical protein
MGPESLLMQSGDSVNCPVLSEMGIYHQLTGRECPASAKCHSTASAFALSHARILLRDWLKIRM